MKTGWGGSLCERVYSVCPLSRTLVFFSPGAILSDVMYHSPEVPDGVSDSEESTEESLGESEEDEDEGNIDEDNCNSAGEELEDEEFDESQVS